jgi:hypothetical protein
VFGRDGDDDDDDDNFKNYFWAKSKIRNFLKSMTKYYGAKVQLTTIQ